RAAVEAPRRRSRLTVLIPTAGAPSSQRRRGVHVAGPMRLPSFTALAVAVACLCLAAPAGAITNGTAAGQDHPNVGGLVSPTQYSDGTWIYCSGTLISPTVFLTAAHCAEGDRVGVTFDPDYVAGDKVYYGTFHADPLYPGPTSDAHDI